MTQPCAHLKAVPVESSGDVVAALCPRCDTQLPAEWLTCTHPDAIEIHHLGERPGRFICNACGGTGWTPETAPEPPEVVSAVHSQ